MAHIQVPPDVSVKKVKEFHQALLGAMKEEGDLVVDFGGVKRVDLAVMQVMLAAKRACGRERKILKIKSASGELKGQMRICGMIK